ncbi:MAG: multidrug transporter substrate-binding protein, partial [Deltaproteobacteria bacterium]|nr:multidrug transporter substrate-binding protein [Deltaproteobacteria bacterium]
MTIIETVEVAFDALSANKLRSALTMLGVVIGVASVILLVSIGEGARNYISEQFAGLGTNLLIIQPGKVETKGMLPPVSTTKKLTYADAEVLKKRGYPIKLVAPLVIGTGTVKYQNRHRDIPIIGVTPEFQEARNLRVEVGSFITDVDVKGERNICVLGRKVASELFGTSNPLGKMISINEARYRVVGLMEKKGVSLGTDIDDIVFIPLKSAQTLFNTDRLFEIIVSIAESEEIERGINITTQVLKKRHDGKEDFTITSQAAMLSTFQTILTSMTFVGDISGSGRHRDNEHHAGIHKGEDQGDRDKKSRWGNEDGYTVSVSGRGRGPVLPRRSNRDSHRGRYFRHYDNHIPGPPDICFPLVGLSR